jgi:hypothetical protein
LREKSGVFAREKTPTKGYGFTCSVSFQKSRGIGASPWR